MNILVKMWQCLVGAAVIAMLSGCGGMGGRGDQNNPMAGLMGAQMAQMDPDKMMGDMTAKMNFSQEMMKNPDLSAWHAQREKMALALGDRVFDKEIGRASCRERV